MKSLLTTCLFLLIYSIGNGSDYAVAHIPDNLKKNMDAVIRKQQTQLKVKGPQKATLHVTKVVTILKERANSHALLSVSYDELLEKPTIIRAVVYDAQGKAIGKISKKAFQDFNRDDESSMVTSYRLMGADARQKEFPYTVEFVYEKQLNGLFYYPSWQPIFSAKTSIEQGTLSIHTPQDFAIRHRGLNMDQTEPEKQVIDNETVYTWKLHNKEGIDREKYGPTLLELLPKVSIVPLSFEAKGHEGSLTSWKEFGAFFYALNHERDELPTALKEKVTQIIKDKHTTFERVDAIYKFVQANTRYISIQLGMGGYQTFDAKYVYKNGYGDCKALTNYTRGLLKEAGIPSFDALVKAGYSSKDIEVGFPSAQFNHVILCVPTQEDTIWLECTSSHSPTGHLGSFTSDRHVLLITPQGGVITSTPKNSPKENTVSRTTTIFLNEKGQANIRINASFTGDAQLDIQEVVKDKNNDQQEKWIKYSFIDNRNTTLKEFSFYKAEQSTDYQLQCELYQGNVASVSGNRIFLTPFFLHQGFAIPDHEPDRAHPIILTGSSYEEDAISFFIPEGYELESIPESAQQVKTDFANLSYELQWDSSQRALKADLALEYIPQTLAPDYYEVFRTFFKQLSTIYKTQVVFVKK